MPKNSSPPEPAVDALPNPDATVPPVPTAPERSFRSLGLSDALVQAVRRISYDLRPSMLDDFGLLAAMEWQALEWQRRTDITCRLVFVPDLQVDLSDRRRTAVFRAFQESLTNIARHSHATEVVVTAELAAGQLVGWAGPQLDDVGARHNPQDLAALDHRHLADAMLGHDLLQALHRVLGADPDLALGHIVRDGHGLQAQAPCPVDLAARQDADDLAALAHHREPLEPVAQHELGRLFHRGFGRQGVDAVGHDLAHGHQGMDVPLQHVQQRLAGRLQVRLFVVERVFDILMVAVLGAIALPFVLAVPDCLDLERLRAATLRLPGRHEFSCFALAGGSHRSAIRTLFRAAWEDEAAGFTLRITGDGFLRGMVRKIVGMTLMVGKGKLSLDEFTDTVIQQKEFRIHNLASPAGLFLSKVKYPYID